MRFSLLTLLAALMLALPGSAAPPAKAPPLRCVPKAPPRGQFSPGNTNPNSPAGVLWINRHCRR